MSTPHSHPSDTPAVPPSDPSRRMRWMDLLRGLAVVLVVIMHGATIPLSTDSGFREWVVVNQYLEPVRMPLLMFLSGMLLPRALKKSSGEYLWGKFAAVGWPALVWMVLYGVLVFRNGPFDAAYWATGDYLWFLLALLGCYVIALITRAVHPGVTAAAMITVTSVVSLTILPDRILYYGTFFFLGAWLGRWVLAWSRLPRTVPLLLLVPAAVLSHLAVQDGSLRGGNWQAAAISMVCLALVMWFAPKIPSNAHTRFLEWMGRHSLVVYVVHFPILVVVHRTMDSLDADPLVHVTATTLLGLGLTVGMVLLRPRTPWLYQFPRRWTPARWRRGNPSTGPDAPVSGRR
ncbi:MAG: acyltransferase [Nesterenkonia sp.]|nr:acyltransferase [Nesterenkonia sp.]